ncbi:uncharacterized protein N7459_007840 [Penicillium hispanicum]|uniref:uncharacterized protein n=1 Tax=Penicillium hispanicum TaxID=1080232 RepID=UPI00253FD458|nr:uncharacterized protein N7459_007840 [Penicillium hispanicum]KAJ5573413.1 hypothetical protein N7459_007840 [Penicillium hispanicum]
MDGELRIEAVVDIKRMEPAVECGSHGDRDVESGELPGSLGLGALSPAASTHQERSGFNDFLHDVKRADSPLCPACRKDPRTVRHVLMVCPGHEDLCYEIWEAQGAQQTSKT